ncbi:undecaprenyldiphospho-muramoylpentapeptide beta-N-acetylglucosaminyltransferase [Ampullimonas aquatilis]|uniref:undecaprenyldiphospho-muramoylpentapeptide beta-N-acetylglucosaminyltransferase n=1 Tax=Ampullimonas aquatilis TaxID=1341549 RepID=UPI003C75AB79
MNARNSTKTMLVMAGGTGGHIFPALAVAEVMKAKGWNIVWLGNETGMEAKLAKQHGYPIEFVRFGGLRGKGMVTKLLLPFNLLRALLQTYGVFCKVKPNVVLGMGGYVTVPGGIIARLMGKPLVLHEQNSIAGMANRVLAKLASKVLIAFPNALPKAAWTGNPIRQVLTRQATPESRYGARQGPLQILVVGGSLGAQALNKVVPAALGLLFNKLQFEVTHQAGAKLIDELRKEYKQHQVPVRALPFIDDMATAYANADLVICRAGAMTVSEIAAVGVAAIFIPFPYAVDDHQTSNAQFLVDQGAGICMKQKDLTAEKLANLISLMSREQLKGMAVNARGLAKLDAADKVAAVCMALAK